MFYEQKEFQSEQKRIEFIGRLQESVLDQFPDTSDYNVYFFGSFVTKKFVAGKSDIDIGVFCLNLDKCMDITKHLYQLMNELSNIKAHIVSISSYAPKQFINYNILVSPYCITDLNTVEMRQYLFSLYREYLEYAALRERQRRFVGRGGLKA